MIEATNNEERQQKPLSPHEELHTVSNASKLQDNVKYLSTESFQVLDGGHLSISLPHGAAAKFSSGFDQAESIEYRNQKISGITGADGYLKVICGPLLNYKGMSNFLGRLPTWHGSVLIVSKPGKCQPQLHLKFIQYTSANVHNCSNLHLDPSEDASGLEQGPQQERYINGINIYEDRFKTFWRFDLELNLQESEALWEYTMVCFRFLSAVDSHNRSTRRFVVPSFSQSMRIMFHSCNGFSVGTDVDEWSGPALWNDVLRMHKQKPFHVMIGGGDQIYNDGVRVDGPLHPWTRIGNPRKRREFPFDAALRDKCDLYYFENYVKWYSTGAFARANAEIPQVNVWDDHDIIDGFGSYTDHFMKCAVFRGIGEVSFKYYLLFQHHVPPPKSNNYSSSGRNQDLEGESVGTGLAQVSDISVCKEREEDPCFILGDGPGPYVGERSRSIYMQLGARLAFLGIDARTERTRHQVNYESTYDLIFRRLRSEMNTSTQIKHLIVLLGVPIAYPRLAWLENIFNSPIIGPIRFLHKRFGIAGGLFNHFDGQVDLLDDLDDHYTSRQHKRERRDLVHRLQSLAQKYNIRITILGGDVHLAAVGRFYSAPKLAIPIEHDHRYMANVVSSAITNKPPPKAVANLLARRNKIHHLDHETHETLMKLFDRDPGDSNKTANSNHCTMPSRNYAIITEVEAGAPLADINGNATHEVANHTGALGEGSRILRIKVRNGHSPLHEGEDGVGTKHIAASGVQKGTLNGGLDVSIRVEIDQHDPDGKTEGYGFSSEFSIFPSFLFRKYQY